MVLLSCSAAASRCLSADRRFATSPLAYPCSSCAGYDIGQYGGCAQTYLLAVEFMLQLDELFVLHNVFMGEPSTLLQPLLSLFDELRICACSVAGLAIRLCFAAQHSGVYGSR